MDPCLATFKRIDKITAWNDDSDSLIAKLQLIGKASVRIDSLDIDEDDFRKLIEFYKDKEVNLIIESLVVTSFKKDNISDEEAEFINKISPKMLCINAIKWTVDYIKALALLNCTIIDAFYSSSLWMIYSNIWFINTPIQLFDSKSYQSMTFEWESIKISIEKNKIENVKLLKTKTGNFIFIPFDIIYHISYLGFRKILSEVDISKLFANLSVKNQFENTGLIISMGYSNRIFIELGDDDLDYLNQYKDMNQIFKEIHIELTINSLDRLLEIKNLLPNDFLNINFKYMDRQSIKYAEDSISEILDSPDWSNLKFKEIYQLSILSLEQFQFWWKILRSRRTRWSLTSIDLKFSLLSEWLTVLTLCWDCPELMLVELRYRKADKENEDEAFENAKREFRQKLGFIPELTLKKY